MIIKRDKDYEWKMIFTLLGVAVMAVVYLVGLEMSVGLCLLLNTPVLIFLLAFAISYGRTFVLTEEGCEVCFLWLRKQYTWGQLKTKRIEEYPRFTWIPSGDCPYLKYAVGTRGRFSCPLVRLNISFNNLLGKAGQSADLPD